MEGGDSEIAKSTLPTLRAFLKARSQEFIWQLAKTCCSCYRMPPNAFFSQALVIWSDRKNDAKTPLPPPHRPRSPFPCNSCKRSSVGILYCFAILGSASTVIHSVKQHLLRNRPENAGQLRPFAISCAKDYEGQTSFAQVSSTLSTCSTFVSTHTKNNNIKH